MDLTPVIAPLFRSRFRRTENWASNQQEVQLRQLLFLLERAARTEVGRHYDFSSMVRASRSPQGLDKVYSMFRNSISPREYEEFRPAVMRMVSGEKDVLWPGRCFNFAQSSGTSGGRSKYVPVTDDSLRHNHYRGSADCVASYLTLNPRSHLFSGKGFILGGSFASELKSFDPRVKIGDLSASLIDKIPLLGGLFRIPSKQVALMPDWETKLPALAEAAADCNVTNISGVPSWFLTVIKRICQLKGRQKISEVWPNLEVFFHGGISFEPYRRAYSELTDPEKMHFLETYNASEGFFAVQNDFSDPGLLLLIDNGIFFEFLPEATADPLAVWEVEAGKTYELIISSCNGLWRYRTGDTVRIESVAPLKLVIAGRTRGFINAFGEELMEDNAEKAMAAAAGKTGAIVSNYTAAPLYAEGNRRGCHQWAVEFEQMPADPQLFGAELDAELRRLNSDYDAKRAHTIFLDPPQIIVLPKGAFENWLHAVGTHKLGGQRKVPRLSNSRHILEKLLADNPQAQVIEYAGK